MAGSLMPPSYVVPFPHLRGPALPPLDMRISSGLGHRWKSILTLLHHLYLTGNTYNRYTNATNPEEH